MYAIYGNIYHQYTPVMFAYIPYMDPMGYVFNPPELNVLIPYKGPPAVT